MTSCEEEISEVKKRVNSFKNLLHEVRLDFISSLSSTLNFEWLNSPEIIATLRPVREGGKFEGSDEKRVEILCRAIDSGAGLVDIEFSTPEKLRKKIAEKASGKAKVILSYHDFSGNFEKLSKIVTAMEKEDGDIIKIAVRIDDSAQIKPLLDVAKKIKKPKIILGMGYGGILSRIFPEKFGSFMTYVAQSEGRETAPLQLTLEKFLLYRNGRVKEPILLGIIGNEGVLGSHGLRVYNTIFAERKLNYTYVPVITKSIKKVLPVLKSFGFLGVSVTMPHKTGAFKICNWTSKETKLTGSVNTLKFYRGKIYGYNTDIIATIRIFNEIEQKKRNHGRKFRVAIVGAGGVARAVAAATYLRGWKATIFNRTEAKAQELSRKFNMNWDSFENLEKKMGEFDILINCTSIGMDSSESILNDFSSLKGKIVIDLVSHPPVTKLLEKAKMFNAKTISGVKFWCMQGKEQMKILLSKNFALDKYFK